MSDLSAPFDADALEFQAVRGLLTARGGATAHSAILARALGIPAVVGAGERVLTLEDGVEMILDGGSLTLEWREQDEHVIMTGPVAYVAEGVLDPTLLGKPRAKVKPKPQLAVSA